MFKEINKVQESHKKQINTLLKRIAKDKEEQLKHRKEDTARIVLRN